MTSFKTLKCTTKDRWPFLAVPKRFWKNLQIALLPTRLNSSHWNFFWRTFNSPCIFFYHCSYENWNVEGSTSIHINKNGVSVCLHLRLNSVDSKTNRSIFIKKSVIEKDIFHCVFHLVSSHCDVQELLSNSKYVTSTSQCSGFALLIFKIFPTLFSLDRFPYFWPDLKERIPNVFLSISSFENRSPLHNFPIPECRSAATRT